MNENELQRIAAATHALRPDWPTTSLVTLLKRPELASKTRRDVAVALAWVACESETKTPARVLEAGPWWAASNASGSVVRYPPTREQSCRKHPGEWPESCRGCAGDRLAADESDAGTTPEHRLPDPIPALTLARGRLHSATAHLCPCGVHPRLCAEHKPTPTTKES